MFDVLHTIAPYAPIIIYLAALLDIFFATGLLLYGAAMMSSVLILHASGMISVPGILTASFLGTMTGSAINFYSGMLFAKSPFVQRQLTHEKMLRPRTLLSAHGLFMYIVIGRFITFTRPLYALLLGSLQITASRFFLYESIVAASWVIFWLFILLQGEALISEFLFKA